MSNSVSSAIFLHSTNGKLGPNAEATATFIKRCNDIFDIFNSAEAKGNNSWAFIAAQ